MQKTVKPGFEADALSYKVSLFISCMRLSFMAKVWNDYGCEQISQVLHSIKGSFKQLGPMQCESVCQVYERSVHVLKSRSASEKSKLVTIKAHCTNGTQMQWHDYFQKHPVFLFGRSTAWQPRAKNRAKTIRVCQHARTSVLSTTRKSTPFGTQFAWRVASGSVAFVFTKRWSKVRMNYSCNYLVSNKLKVLQRCT